MCVLYFIVSFMLLSASYGSGVSSYEDYERDIVNEDNNSEVSITTVFSILRTEINHKFNAVRDKLSDIQVIKQDMDILKKKIPDFEENLENKLYNLDTAINEKFSNLQNSIIDRLEGYIKGKIEYIDHLIHKKIDGQEIIMPKLTDIKIIGDKLDFLLKNQVNLEKHIACEPKKVSNDTMERVNKEISKKINQIQINIFELKNKTSDFNLNVFPKHIIKLKEKIDLLEKNVNNKTDTLQVKIADILVVNGNDELKKLRSEFNGNIIEKLKLIVNEAQGKVYDKIIKKINVIEENISEVKNITTHLEHASLDVKLTHLEDDLNREIKKNIPTIKDYIERKLDALDNKIPPHFEDNLHLKLNTMAKNILTIKDNIICTVDVPNNTNIQDIEHTLPEMQNNSPELKQNITKSMDTLKNIESLTETRASVRCKERVTTKPANYDPYYRLDNKSLPHVPVSYDSAGGLANLYMHLRIKGLGYASILLSSSSPVRRDGGNLFYQIAVGFNNNVLTSLWPSHDVENINPKIIRADTPNILSPEKFTDFFIKINNETLKFGKENGSTILELPDPRVKQIKYFAMAAYNGVNVTFLYDC